LIRRGRDREPLPYILGGTDFHGMRNFQVSSPVLIPRPETEQLVELIIQSVKPPDRFIDVCCGSGAIAIALLRAWPTSTAVALDCSAAAVALTRENAVKFGVISRLEIVHSRLADYEIPSPPPDLVVSNPPYIPTDRLSTLQREITDWEDPLALDGGEDGLKVIHSVVDKFGSAPELWMEIDSESGQAEKLQRRGLNIQVYPDWFGQAGRFFRFIS